MTRPKGDTDPWLTDPISRDRVIAKTVVEGMRTIISLLRGIRDEMAEDRAYRAENSELRAQLADLQEQIDEYRAIKPPLMIGKYRTAPYMQCENEDCSLPLGHRGNHRGSLASQQ
jgi:hypothetical protein